MQRNSLTRAGIQYELDDLGDQFPRLSEDNLFVLWYMLSLVEDDAAAAATVVGASNDKGVDAVFIDHRQRCVFVVQGKLRDRIMATNESRNDVMGLAALSDVLSGAEEAFADYSTRVEPSVREKLAEARDCVTNRRYKFELHFVTLGKCAPALRTEARKYVERNFDNGKLKIFDGDQVLRLFADYLDGASPGVSDIELPFEKQVGSIHRFDATTGIDSWIITMRGHDLGKLYEHQGDRLFHRNIRGFLDHTSVNTAMSKTLASEPEYFWYFNNGVTIVCDNAEEVQRRGTNILRVHRPQIINGQQTTRMLHQSPGSDKPSVLVRVIHIPRTAAGAADRFDSLVSSIVKATNWQNAIKASDLVSNDRQQVAIGRELKKADYYYVRKRQSKSQANRAYKAEYQLQITKEELAKAVGACVLPSPAARRGTENLFEPVNYQKIFPNHDANFYLCKFWLHRKVTELSRGYPERGFAKTLVTHFAWSELRNLIDQRPDAFLRGLEKRTKNEDLDKALEAALNKIFIVALQFYKNKRGTGPRAKDISGFFNRPRIDSEFSNYWSGPTNRQRRNFESAVARIAKTLETNDDTSPSKGLRQIDSTAIRKWARINGIEVSMRGRISRDVIDAYTTAN